MPPDLFSLPWVKNASGAIQWILILLFALDKLLNYLKDARSHGDAQAQRRRALEEAASKLDIDRFSELSDAQKEFLAIVQAQNEELRKEIKELKAEVTGLNEENRKLRGEIADFRRVQGENREILGRIDAKTDKGG